MADDITIHRPAMFKHRFGVEIETSFNIVAMCTVSERADDKPFTPEQKAWMDGFDDAASLAR